MGIGFPRALAGACLGALLTGTAAAQAWGADERTQQLVDEMRTLLDRAEQERTASPWFLQDARELLQRYDWPWRAERLYDDFQDGDYENAPAWSVARGEFWVAASVGLRTRTEAEPSTGSDDGARREPGEEIVGLLLREMLGDGSGEPASGAAAPAAGPAEIHTPVTLSNAFLAELEVTSLGAAQAGGHLEWGPYQGEGRAYGYRLVYRTGADAALELRRVAPGRSAVVEAWAADERLRDGEAHTFTWLRHPDGTMAVQVDSTEVMRAADRGFSGAFDGFLLVNHRGDFAVRRVRLAGTGG